MLSELKNKGRLCAIDFGLKRIGFALSNKSFTLATKFACIENKGFKNTQQFLSQAITNKEIIAFLVGWPLTPNGDESNQCKLVDNFCKKLHDAFNLPIIKFDERYSTKHCQQIFGKKPVLDDKVAAFFLQNFLDMQFENNDNSDFINIP